MPSQRFRKRANLAVVSTAERTVFAVSLAAWFGLAPLLQVLHLTTSTSHGHVFCLEHAQFEEAPERTSGGHEDSASNGIPALGLILEGPSSVHQACALLAHCASREPILLPESCAIASGLSQSEAPPLRQATSRAIRALLLIAPKHSPPDPIC